MLNLDGAYKTNQRTMLSDGVEPQLIILIRELTEKVEAMAATPPPKPKRSAKRKASTGTAPKPCKKCGRTDHARSTSRLCPYNKKNQQQSPTNPQ